MQVKFKFDQNFWTSSGYFEFLVLRFFFLLLRTHLGDRGGYDRRKGRSIRFLPVKYTMEP